MKSLPILLLLIASKAAAAELEPLMSDQALWQSDAKTIAGNHRDIRFGWNSADHTSAKLYGTNTLFGLAVADVTLDQTNAIDNRSNVVQIPAATVHQRVDNRHTGAQTHEPDC